MADITDRYEHPKDVLLQLNSKVTDAIAGTDFFLTAFFAVINTDTLDLVCANAGHAYTMLCRNNSTEIRQIGENTKGTVLGSFKEIEFSEEKITLEAGDSLLFFTDGIVEARNDQKEFYSAERLEFLRWEWYGLEIDAMFKLKTPVRNRI